MRQLLEKHLAAYAAADWNGYKADLAPNVVYDEIPTGKHANGPDAYVETVKAWKVAFPDSRGEIKLFFGSGDFGTLEFEWGGTHTGVLQTPFGTVQPTNQKIRVKSVLISKVENGKFVEVRLYFDMLNLLQQLGVTALLPTTPSEEKRALLH